MNNINSSNSMYEVISCLVDDEAELTDGDLEHLKSRPDVAAKWTRYHLMGDAMRGTLPQANARDFSERVMQVVIQEPVVLAPSKPRSRPSNTFLRPIVGSAVAAVVAVVAIISLQTLQQSGSFSPAPNVAAVDNNVQLNTSSFMIDNGTSRRSIYSNNLRWQGGAELKDVALEEELNIYLIDHAQQSSSVMQRMLPYARVVGYDLQSQ